MKKIDAKAAKKTFWNDLRVKNGYSYRELSETLDTSIGTLGNWFSGRSVPNKEKLKELCDLFGVGLEVGRAEFAKATKCWVSERGHIKFSEDSDISEVAPIVPTVVTDVSEEVIERALSQTPQTAEVKSVDIPYRDVLKQLYNKLDFDEYEHFRALCIQGVDPMETLYNKGIFSFDEFMEIMNLLGAK